MAVLKVQSSWNNKIEQEFAKPYMVSLKQFLTQLQHQGKTFYPKGNEIFRALDLTPFEQVKVVILGQDPYHGPNQAHGLCFSVKPGIKPPPSLMNIYKELQADLGIVPPKHGYLESWAKQGILMLNSVLTVEPGLAASHQGKGWETFTDAVIEKLASQQKPIVFILWGAYAQKKGQNIDTNRHCVIKSAHPSPLSAHRGFFGSKPFSACNDFLTSTGQKPIDWSLPELA